MTISKRLYANNAKTTLVNPITPYDESIQVADGSIFPSPGPGEYFLITITSGIFVEVIKVTGRSGAVFTGCIRGQENKPATSFPAGARLENRVTKETLDSFETAAYRLSDITTVDNLDRPSVSNANTYICHSNDTSGNPIIAMKAGANTWRFSSHSVVAAAGTVSSSTFTSITSSAIRENLRALVAGEYIVQFLTGIHAGLCRTVTSSGTNALGWATEFQVPPSIGDTFEVYRSNSTILKSAIDSADDSVVYAIILN